MDPVDFGGENEAQNEPVVESITNEPVEDLVNPFLANVPAQDRAIVGRYIKEWDSGAQKKFREYVERLKPYETIGKPEEVTRAVNFSKNFMANPEQAFKLLWNGLQEQYGDDFEGNLRRILEIEEAMNDELEYEGGEGFESEELDPRDIEIQNLKSEVERLSTGWDEFQSSQQTAEEMKQLDSVIQAMHTKYGDFDETYIVTRLAEHGSVDQAFKDWQKMIGQYGGSPRQVPPKVMGGQGGVPQERIQTEKLRNKDRRAAVAAMLEGSEG